MEMFIELITTLGFPIACVIAMGIFIYKIYQKSEQREDKLMQVNEKAIATIAKYADSLEVIKTDISEIKTEVNHLSERIN